jgi:LacI family xylobiose transport system transcriptional regulator
VTNELAEDPTSAAPAPRATRATLADIAALASVSVATVSKVLNGRDGVSDETRDRIDALLDARGYSRRTTAHRPAPVIDVLCFDIASPFSAAMTAALERVVRRAGRGLVISGAEDDYGPPAGWVDGVLHRDSLGVILLLSELSPRIKTRLRSRDIPVVAINPFGPPAADASSIGSADWNGGFLATRHLQELGHTRIAIIKGPEGMQAAAARLAGYRTALETAGIPVRPEWIKPGRFVHADGYAQGRALLELEERPTAVFASSDLQALGVYDAARSLGLDIPGDLSVIGYGDLSVSQWASPAMTSVHVPIAQMAEAAMTLVERSREQPGLSFRHVDLPTELVVRASTAPPRRAS